MLSTRCRPLLAVPLVAFVLVAIGLPRWRGPSRVRPAPTPEESRGAALDRALALALARLRFKEGLVDEMFAGRLPLREAATRLRDYLTAEPAPPEGALTGRDNVAAYPGRTEEERCARSLHRWCQCHVIQFPSEAATRAMGRLDRELAEIVGGPP
jgi:hypothetical protein